MQSIIGKGYGKVILFGEYAVLSGGNAMVFASELGASASYQAWPTQKYQSTQANQSIQSAYNRNQISTHHANDETIYEIDGGELGCVRFRKDDRLSQPLFPFAQSILQHYPAPYGRYMINSEACSIQDPIHGRTKIGLGSSSASTMALLDLLYQLNINDQQAFPLDLKEMDISSQKMPSLDISKFLYFHTQAIHQKIQGLGSGADVAASAMGGYIAYSYLPMNSLDKTPKAYHQYTNAITQESTQGVTAIEQQSFPIKIALNQSHFGAILPLTDRLKRPLLCAWSGQSASTSQLVKQVKNNTPPLEFQSICQEISALTQALIHTWQHDSEQVLINQLFDGIKTGERLIKALSKAAGVSLWTEMHELIKDKVEKLGGVCKSTGAGGGDLVWILGQSEEHEKQISQKLEQDGIQCLFFHLAPRRF
jgi:mevalonate kinase